MGEFEGPELTFRQITGCVAAMTSQVLPTNKNKFVLAVFMQACENITFHNKWMTANTWAESICLNYQLPEGIQFDGTALNKAITSSIVLCLALDTPKDNVPRDHCSIFVTLTSLARTKLSRGLSNGVITLQI